MFRLLSRDLSRPAVDRIPVPRSREWHRRAKAGLLVVLVFSGLFPVLSRVEFHQSIENLNVATAMEMRRGGPWLVPTLQGVPRLAKPPLTAWITAGAITPDVMEAMNAADPAVRAAAYADLARQSRWPALLAMCVLLLATYEFARAAVGGGGGHAHRVALTAVVVCATTFFFIRYATYATTDVYLALSVSLALWFLARAVFLQKYSPWLQLAGLALGVALVAKGPVALVHTILPLGLFLLICRRFAGNNRQISPDDFFEVPRRSWLAPALIGAALMIVIGGVWYLVVAARHEGVWAMWKAEVTRIDADEVPEGKWFQHFVNLWQFGPWAIWILLPGAAAAISDLRARRASPAVMSLLALFAPMLVLSLAKDRFDRYLLPLLPAGSLLAAIGLGVLWDKTAIARRGVRTLRIVHWAIIGGAAIGFPLLAASGKARQFTTVTGQPWFSWPLAIGLAFAAIVVVVTGLRIQRHRPGVLIGASFVLLIVTQIAYLHGRSQSGAAKADFRPAADLLHEQYPDAVVYALRRPKRNVINIRANGLSIYMNRPAQWAPDLATMAQQPHPVAWVTGGHKNDPDPPTPPGWKLLFRTAGADKKIVFVRPWPPDVAGQPANAQAVSAEPTRSGPEP